MNLTFRVMHSLEDPDSINPDTPNELEVKGKDTPDRRTTDADSPQVVKV